MSHETGTSSDAPTTPAQDDLSGVLREIAKAADEVEQQDAETRQKIRLLGERLHTEAVRGERFGHHRDVSA